MPAKSGAHAAKRALLETETQREHGKGIRNERRMETTAALLLLLLFDRYIPLELYPPIKNSFVPGVSLPAGFLAPHPAKGDSLVIL